MATANPAANEELYRRAGQAESAAQVMTLGGTVLKTSVLMVLLLLTAGYTWTQFREGAQGLVQGLAILGAIGGMIVAFVTIFFPKASPITAPIYALLEGLLMGATSVLFESVYPGIVIQAVGLSVGVLALMLFFYGTGFIRATEKFKMGVVAATGAIFLVYMVEMLLSLFGIHIPYIHGAGPIGIIFSIVVVVIAALNLILDFDFIDKGVAYGAPKYMEWYGGFTLLVTLIWMYLEILRLLAKLQGGSRE